MDSPSFYDPPVQFKATTLQEMEHEIESLLRSSEVIRRAVATNKIPTASPETTTFPGKGLLRSEVPMMHVKSEWRDEKSAKQIHHSNFNSRMQNLIEELTSELEVLRFELKLERQDNAKNIEIKRRKADQVQMELIQQVSAVESQKLKLEYEVNELQKFKVSALNDRSAFLQEFAALKQQCAFQFTENAELKAELYSARQVCQKLQTEAQKKEKDLSEGAFEALRAELRRKDAVIKELQDGLNKSRASSICQNWLETDLHQLKSSLMEKGRENEQLTNQQLGISSSTTPDTSSIHSKPLDLSQIEKKIKRTTKRISRLEQRVNSSHTNLSCYQNPPKIKSTGKKLRSTFFHTLSELKPGDFTTENRCNISITTLPKKIRKAARQTKASTRESSASRSRVVRS